MIEVITSEHIRYEDGMLILTVLGGIKLEYLDRMRVTLKISLKDNPRPPLRHNLDLYNDTQVERLVRKTAEKLEIGTSVIAASIADLTEELEAWRMQQLNDQLQDGATNKELTETELHEATTFLQSDNLLQRTNELIGQSGVIGEEINRLIMYLVFTSRKREQPLHCISLGSSGTGKTHLQEKVGEQPAKQNFAIAYLLSIAQECMGKAYKLCSGCYKMRGSRSII